MIHLSLVEARISHNYIWTINQLKSLSGFRGGDVTGLHQWLIDSENFHGSFRLEEIVEIQASSWVNQLAQDENIRVCASAV